MSRNAIVCFVTICLSSTLVLSSSLQRGPNHDLQRQVVDDDEYIPYLHSGWRVSDNFDWLLLKELSNKYPGNTIISPISLKLILALLYEGAGGLTELELQNVLQFTNKTEVRQDYAKILESLTDGKRLNCVNQPPTGVKSSRSSSAPRAAQTPTTQEQYTLNIGTRIFLDQAVKPLQPFEAKACEKYQTKIVSTDFQDTAKTSTKINDFVNRLTLGKIQRLVEPGDVSDSVMMLVNALYFRGYWSHQFPKDKSHTGGFYLSPGQAVQVPYMATTDVYFYLESEALDAKIIRIPYKGKKFSMIVILPNAKAGLDSLLERINVMKLHPEIYKMDKQSVDLVLPKFMFDYQAKMSDTLKNMGLVSMFGQMASLPGIVRGSDFKLQVSDIIQKAGIEINEEGSTAFAASEIQLTNKFGDAQAVFNATHPFLFYIEDQVARSILFVGKVVNPRERHMSALAPLPARHSEDIGLPAPPSKLSTKR